MEQLIFYISLAFLVNVIGLLLVAWRFKIIINITQEKVTYLHALFTNLLSRIIGFLLPLRFAAKPLFLKYYDNISIKKGSLITILEQFLDFALQILIIFILIILMGKEILSNLYSLWLVLIVSLIPFSILLFYKQIINIIWRFSRFLPQKIKNFAKAKKITKEKVKYYFQLSVAYLYNKKNIMKILPISLVHIFLMPFLIIFLLKAYSVSVSYGVVFMAYWLSLTLGKISGLPLGFGVRDVSLWGFLVTFGVPSVIAVKLTVIYRIIVEIPALVIGISLFLQIGKTNILRLYHKYKIPNSKTI